MMLAEDEEERGALVPTTDLLMESNEGDESLPTTVQPRARRRMIRAVASICVIFVITVTVLSIGASMEARAVAQSNTTLHLYQDQTEVCAMDLQHYPFFANPGLLQPSEHRRLNEEDSSTNNPVGRTFASVSQVVNEEDNYSIVHCGSCGQCSTMQDMAILAKTRNSLTQEATVCAFAMLFWSSDAMERCMEHRIGFSPECNECWMDNIRCTAQKCPFTCLKSRLFGEDNNKGDDSLNSCLECDERMCGPQFLSCSGSNRRRMGLVSDIGRDPLLEQCKSVEMDWVGLVGSTDPME